MKKGKEMTYSASGNPLDPTDNVEEIYWDETHHSTGYPHLDRQHKEIITLYNQLVGSCLKLPPILGQRLKTIFMHNLP